MASTTAQRLGAASLEAASRSRSAHSCFGTIAERTRHCTQASASSRAALTRQFSASTRQLAFSPAASASSPRPAYNRPSPPVRPAQSTSVRPPQTERESGATAPQPEPLRDISTSGLSDAPSVLPPREEQVDWTTSFHGLSTEAFSQEAQDTLLQPLNVDDIEVKPDGILYLPEIKYRRILNKAFGPGGWGLAPRGETIVTAKSVTREYALVAKGR